MRGFLGVEAVADTDQGDAGHEGEKGGVGKAWGEFFAGCKQAEKDSEHCDEVNPKKYVAG